jgi:hypothetical protein
MPSGTSVASSLTTMLTNAPLPSIIEKLGVAIANAQYAMDHNGVRIAKEMANTRVEIGENNYNMLALGFTPAFYHFTEANVEAKLAFSMTQSSSIEGSASAGGSIGLVAVSVEASYSRKFSMSAEGSSSVSARLVSLPAPAIFEEILRREYQSLSAPVPNTDSPAADDDGVHQ